MRGLTQVELAKRAGVSKESIHKWENDKTSPQGRFLMMLGKALGVTMGAFDTSVPLEYAIRDEWKEGEKWIDPRRRGEEENSVTLRFRGRVVFEWERHGVRLLKVEAPDGRCQLVLVIDIDQDGSKEFKRSIQSALNQSDS